MREELCAKHLALVLWEAEPELAFKVFLQCWHFGPRGLPEQISKLGQGVQGRDQKRMGVLSVSTYNLRHNRELHLSSMGQSQPWHLTCSASPQA